MSLAQDTLLCDFEAGKSLIPVIVERQNGSLTRAFVELYLNALDAEAKTIKISGERIDGGLYKIVLTDDGKGLPSDLEELKRAFTMLGVDEVHPNDRKFGEFHLGRTQIANFGRVVWRGPKHYVECDLRSYMGIAIRQHDEPDVKGTTIEVYVPADAVLYGCASLFKSIKTECELVTAAELWFGEEKMTPRFVSWTASKPGYDFAIELGESRTGWILYNHGVRICTQHGDEYEDPVVVNFTKRVRTSIARTAIMEDDPLWLDAKAVINQKLDRTMAVNRKAVTHSNLRSIWRRIRDGKIPPASLNSLRCVPLANGDIVKLQDAHRRCSGVIAPVFGKSYYAEFLVRSGRALPVVINYFPSGTANSVLYMLNQASEGMDIRFTAYDPSSLKVHTIDMMEVDIQAALEATKPKKLHRDRMDRLRQIVRDCVESLTCHSHLKELYGWYHGLSELALIDYPDSPSPVLPSVDGCTFVELSYFAKIKLRTPESVVPLLDRLIRALAWQLDMREYEKNGPDSTRYERILNPMYAPLLAAMLTSIMKR